MTLLPIPEHLTQAVCRVALTAILAVTAATHAGAAPREHCAGLMAAPPLAGCAGHIVGVLSTRMVYALQEWPRMRRAAEQAGFCVQALRDPAVPESDWTAGVEAAGVAELATLAPADPDLAGRCGLLNHFPSTLVLACGRAHPAPVLGVMPDHAWTKVLRSRRADLPCE